MRKKTLNQRLNIIKGQINGLAALIERNEDCQKVMNQFYAVNSGLKKAIAFYLEDNLISCLSSVNSKEKQSVGFVLKEIIKNK